MEGKQQFQVINVIKVRGGNSKISKKRRKWKGESGEKEKQEKEGNSEQAQKKKF